MGDAQFRSITHSDRWMRDAACKGLPFQTFFEDLLLKDACDVCYRCDVRYVCWAFAMLEDLDGVWGGTSQRFRRTHRHRGLVGALSRIWDPMLQRWGEGDPPDRTATQRMLMDAAPAGSDAGRNIWRWVPATPYTDTLRRGRAPRQERLFDG